MPDRWGEMEISGIRGELPTLEAAPSASIAARVTPVAPTRSEGPFVHALRGLAHQVDVGEVQAEAASHLHSYDTGTLLALQVGIYRYTEAVDLASKIVDRASNALKTVLQGGGH